MTANSEWRNLLLAIIRRGRLVSPRELRCSEIISHQSIIPMRFPIVSACDRKLNYQFMAAEAHWILSGSNRLDHHPIIQKCWTPYSDNGITTYGAYGPMVVGQMEHVVNAIKRDKETRQAVMTIWRHNPPQSKDIPCTVSLQFLVREHVIDCVATMRSSDAWLGWPYDVFTFTMISTAVSLLTGHFGLGNLYLTAGSQHLYEKDEAAAIKLVTSEMDCWNYSPMCINGLNTPDDLMNCLGYVMGINGKPLTMPSMFIDMYGRAARPKTP